MQAKNFERILHESYNYLSTTWIFAYPYVFSDDIIVFPSERQHELLKPAWLVYTMSSKNKLINGFGFM